MYVVPATLITHVYWDRRRHLVLDIFLRRGALSWGLKLSLGFTVTAISNCRRLPLELQRETTAMQISIPTIRFLNQALVGMA